MEPGWSIAGLVRYKPRPTSGFQAAASNISGGKHVEPYIGR